MESAYIKIDQSGNAWLKVYADFSDPDDPTPPDYQVKERLALGGVEASGLASTGFSLLPVIEDEFDRLASAWIASRWRERHEDECGFANHGRASYADDLASLEAGYFHDISQDNA